MENSKCEVCKAPIESVRGGERRKRFCSTACRVQAHRNGQRQQTISLPVTLSPNGEGLFYITDSRGWTLGPAFNSVEELQAFFKVRQIGLHSRLVEKKKGK